MEILAQQSGDALDVKVKGRLDNYWTEHLRGNVEEMIRGGAHVIRMDLSEMTYLSSAGVGLLAIFHRKLKGIGGSFGITNPSKHVRMVLDLCHLSPILLAESAPVAAPVHTKEPRRFSTPAGAFEVMECNPETALTCEMIGDPAGLKGCRFGAQDSRTVAFPPATFGLGLGAFGQDFEDAKPRFGEFLAVDGSGAYLPTDGTNVPDFMVSSGDLVPEINVLYGLRFEGGFTHQVRFETAGADRPISLAELVRTALEIASAPVIGMVMVAESAGLVGAALRRSPAAANGAAGAPFEYPEVRSWLSFSTERLYPRSLALVTGIGTGAECAALTCMLRRLGTDAQPAGHFHAAAFTYRPLKKGSIELKATVTTLFETATLQGVLHLISDGREASGRQQSEFVRGAFWIGAATEIR
jgi:anti-anti-sigma factor